MAKSYVECEVCHKDIEITPNRRHSISKGHRPVCSPKCRALLPYDIHGKCGSCGRDFTATNGMQRGRIRRGEHVYCSDLCRTKDNNNNPDKFKREFGPCPSCDKMFKSRRPKKFCSLECYNSSDEFKNMLHKRAEAGRIETRCEQCGKDIVSIKSKQRKFCNQICWRLYLADRFDRWIASPETIALPQAYDEFLTQQELPCLIHGCGWSGKHLGAHVQMVHGIKARDFKKVAGFNLGTGLTRPDLFLRASELASKINEHLVPIGDQPRCRDDYQSLEGIEHKKKSAILRSTWLPPPRNKGNKG